MKVSAQAAETASTNGTGPDSPALAQLKAAIETDPTSDSDTATAAATAVLEAGEEDFDQGDEDQQADDQQAADGNPGEMPQPNPGDEIATETIDAVEIQPANGMFYAPANVAAIIGNPPYSTAPAASSSPAPYDPIAECEEEISEIGERIVAHYCKISELDTALKAEKKSWKTASDELVALFQRKAGLIIEKQEREKREDEAKTTAATRIFTPVLDPSRPQTDLTCLSYQEQKPEVDVVADQSANAASPSVESTESFHARMAAQFAPSPSANLPPTPEQERYDQEFRGMAMEGLDGMTRKILEIIQANGIYTVGNWQDWAAKTGCEYTQMSGGGAKLTEARYTKILDGMMAYMRTNPRPDSVAPVVAPEPVSPASTATSSSTVATNMDVDDI